MRGEIFSTLVGKLQSQEPQVEGPRPAAVSVMLTGRHAPKTLLIKRAERIGDPWSGQVAFPGGKFQEGDKSVRDTAVRETLEEVGVDLATCSEFLGYFRPFRTHTGNMDVVPTLFLLKGDVQVRTNDEVTSHLWVELERLMSDEAGATYILRQGGESREVPAFRVGDYVVWGLTQRIISALLEQPPSQS
jgi:8-oxo-dGTP pyrophosphatase MutT (NUDIX family)